MTRLSARLLAVAAAVSLVAGCGGPAASHYQALLDELTVPAGWELAKEAIKAPNSPDPCPSLLPECPSVTRYYLVPGTPVDAYPSAKQMVTNAGFKIALDTGPACDAPSGGSDCALSGGRGEDLIRVGIYEPGSEIEALGSAPAERTIVLVTATR